MKTNLKQMQESTVITYEPVRQKKLPMYLLTSVEKHTTNRMGIEPFVVAMAVLLALTAILLWLF